MADRPHHNQGGHVRERTSRQKNDIRDTAAVPSLRHAGNLVVHVVASNPMLQLPIPYLACCHHLHVHSRPPTIYLVQRRALTWQPREVIYARGGIRRATYNERRLSYVDQDLFTRCEGASAGRRRRRQRQTATRARRQHSFLSKKKVTITLVHNPPTLATRCQPNCKLEKLIYPPSSFLLDDPVDLDESLDSLPPAAVVAAGHPRRRSPSPNAHLHTLITRICSRIKTTTTAAAAKAEAAADPLLDCERIGENNR